MAEIGHNQPDKAAQEELKRRVDRRMKVEDDIDEMKEDLKLLKKQDKDDGYNEKVLKQIIRELRATPKKRADQLQLEMELNTYRPAVGLPVTLEAAMAAATEAAGEVPSPAEDRTKKACSPSGGDAPEFQVSSSQ